MALNLVSPGISVREVDLTIGNIVGGSQNIGAIAGPFEMGPVNDPVLIENESQLLELFGKPRIEDGQYEYWHSASNYLSYGGSLRVVRSDSNALLNSNFAVGGGSTTLKITSTEDFINNHQDDFNWIVSSKNPGSWANDLKVCIIDNIADQIISGINTSQIENEVFTSVVTTTGTVNSFSNVITGIDTTSIATGQLVIITTPGLFPDGSQVEIIGIGEDEVQLSLTSINEVQVDDVVLEFGIFTTQVSNQSVSIGQVITQPLNKTTVVGSEIITQTGTLRGIITEILPKNKISVKITDRIDEEGVSHPVQYINPGDPGNSIGGNAFSFDTNRNENITLSYIEGGSEINVVYPSSQLVISDWYDSQSIDLQNVKIFWKSIAPKPKTSQYALERNSKNDEVHIIVVDDTGNITGNSGTILERFLGLSKAVDGKITPSQGVYYKNYINDNSKYIYLAAVDDLTSTDIISTGTNFTDIVLTEGFWGSLAQNTKFSAIGSKTYTLSGGKDYSGINNEGGFAATVSNIINSYNIFNNTVEYGINFLINGPSGGSSIFESQAKANALIAIAENRKDCVAVISPHKSSVINVPNSQTQTNNILEFYSSLSSSSYAIFDSGYKYYLDRFNNRFIYLPCNSDVAGLISRTSINNFPWFSPAGSSRGALNSAIKLAYNPTKAQRDQLYSSRINPIILSQGSGVILFGDKTALAFPSAFDRINVRMLFLTIERSIEQAARSQLFQLNDAITRSNFINIVEPYLRDVRAKRGISEFVIICDESNNTPDIVDSNQFKADIFVKPTRSINFIGLTFVATRTGVSFSEVVGTV